MSFTFRLSSFVLFPGRRVERRTRSLTAFTSVFFSLDHKYTLPTDCRALYRTLLALSWTDFGLRFVVFPRPSGFASSRVLIACSSLRLQLPSHRFHRSSRRQVLRGVWRRNWSRLLGLGALHHQETSQSRRRSGELRFAAVPSAVETKLTFSVLCFASFPPLRTRSLSLLEPQQLTSPLPETTSRRLRSDFVQRALSRPLRTGFSSLSPVYP